MEESSPRGMTQKTKLIKLGIWATQMSSSSQNIIIAS